VYTVNNVYKSVFKVALVAEKKILDKLKKRVYAVRA
jgi:hypothetical protein